MDDILLFEDKILYKVYNFFMESKDFNGMSLRTISKELNIEYEFSIDIIKNLVSKNKISIQSSTYPDIIRFKHYPIDAQLQTLEEAKKNTETVQNFGEIIISSENTEFPVCIYPSPEYLKLNRDLKDFNNAVFTMQLALGAPQLQPLFFEIEVLERYFSDPRFDFNFWDYSGEIKCKYDKDGNPIVRKEDQIFLKTFGLGYDSNDNRLAVVYLRYLHNLTPEHQVFWKSKQVNGVCNVLKEYHENSINGNATSSHSIFSGFIEELNLLNKLSFTIFGITIFNKSFENYNRPKEFTFFFTPTLRNYNEFILLIDKMISDNINKDFFVGKVDLFDVVDVGDGSIEKKQKGTLRLFEEWLATQYKSYKNDSVKELLKPFKNIRKERQNPAHMINENIYDKKYTEMQKNVIKSAYNSIYNIRLIFQEHSKAVSVEIPRWLEEGNIKIF